MNKNIVESQDFEKKADIIKVDSKVSENSSFEILEQKFIEEDCKIKFKFTPSSSGITKERLVKRIQYIEK